MFKTVLRNCESRVLFGRRCHSSNERLQETDHLFDTDIFDVGGVQWDPKLNQKVLLVQLTAPLPRTTTATSVQIEKKKDKDALELSEAKSLVRSVHTWQLESVLTFNHNPKHLKSQYLLGPKKLADINQFLSRSKIDIVFINVPQITSLQFANLSSLWKRYVIDRYVLVLTIFRLHASSKEAKLQVARLMVALIKNRIDQNCLPWYLRGKLFGSTQGSPKQAKGAVTAKEARRLKIQALEAKVKTGLERASVNRQNVRRRNLSSHLPLISVIGYTNCGKTTLIKSLTRSHKLNPENKLFATTEASSHFGTLKNDVPCIYNDTVGFISNLPHTLVDAFTASFEEISSSQMIVLITDISHPDWSSQMGVVDNTIGDMLKRMPSKMSCAPTHSWVKQTQVGKGGSELTVEKDSVIRVFNKCDKVTASELEERLDCVSSKLGDKDYLLTTATTGKGVADVVDNIYHRLCASGFLIEQTVIVPSYRSEEYKFLKENAHFQSEESIGPSETELVERVELRVVLHHTVLRKFAALFPLNALSKVVLSENYHELW